MSRLNKTIILMGDALSLLGRFQADRTPRKPDAPPSGVAATLTLGRFLVTGLTAIQKSRPRSDVLTQLKRNSASRGAPPVFGPNGSPEGSPAIWNWMGRMEAAGAMAPPTAPARPIHRPPPRATADSIADTEDWAASSTAYSPAAAPSPSRAPGAGTAAAASAAWHQSQPSRSQPLSPAELARVKVLEGPSVVGAIKDLINWNCLHPTAFDDPADMAAVVQPLKSQLGELEVLTNGGSPALAEIDDLTRTAPLNPLNYLPTRDGVSHDTYTKEFAKNAEMFATACIRAGQSHKDTLNKAWNDESAITFVNSQQVRNAFRDANIQSAFAASDTSSTAHPPSNDPLNAAAPS